MRILASIILMIAACGSAAGRELVSWNNEFGIIRDFSNITLSAKEASKARAFVDIDRFVVDTVPTSENLKLQQIAIADISAKVALAKSKEGANYLIQIRMEQRPNYAIRNPKRAYSRGFVMISLCKLPIVKVAKDCENLQYDYFRNRKAEEVFSTVLGMWLKTTFPVR